MIEWYPMCSINVISLITNLIRKFLIHKFIRIVPFSIPNHKDSAASQLRLPSCCCTFCGDDMAYFKVMHLRVI